MHYWRLLRVCVCVWCVCVFCMVGVGICAVCVVRGVCSVCGALCVHACVFCIVCVDVYGTCRCVVRVCECGVCM